MSELKKLKEQELELRKRIKKAEEKELLRLGKLAKKYTRDLPFEEVEKELKKVFSNTTKKEVMEKPKAQVKK